MLNMAVVGTLLLTQDTPKARLNGPEMLSTISDRLVSELRRVSFFKRRISLKSTK